MGTKI